MPRSMGLMRSTGSQSKTGFARKTRFDCRGRKSHASSLRPAEANRSETSFRSAAALSKPNANTLAATDKARLAATDKSSKELSEARRQRAAAAPIRRRRAQKNGGPHRLVRRPVKTRTISEQLAQVEQLLAWTGQ